jgi:Asp-tRNA(Asn)/Glu-tRNA(Gln) amidotransferase A subunit family amidase
MSSRPDSFLALAERFRSGESSPSAELEARLSRLDEVEPVIAAFVHVDKEQARTSAREADARWRAGQPLSPIDGMAIGIKDIIETVDMPTGQGSPAWEGTRTGRDGAVTYALREAGAIILGKTTTTEFASTHPFHKTRNPHDPERTPGGSSSGSAAAVAAGIVPVAIGTQVVGSTLRPASFCGCVGYKPTFGALNRSGSFDHLSQSCLGLLAATPADTWIVASAVASRVGGDPGQLGLTGPDLPPAPRRPARMAVLQTVGWAKATDGARSSFSRARAALDASGITLCDRETDPEIDRFEEEIADANELTFRIFSWELRWPLGAYHRRDPDSISEASRARLAEGQTLTLADYHLALTQRSELRARYAGLLSRYDAVMTLGALGAAPVGLGWTGDPTNNIPASLLGIPAVSLPLLEDEGLPLGLQLMGRANEDADLLAVSEWIWRNAPTQIATQLR